jgi:tRNA threonylcarbamoyladenosine biosynthesis protein TsaE
MVRMSERGAYHRVWKMSRRIFSTSSAAETISLAGKIAETFEGREVVFLIGELGAGKTVFAKGIALGLGLKNINQVCSPTFTLMNVYQARVPIYHFDLYRLAKADEIRELDFEDYIGRGVVIVEWAEKMPFPLDAITIAIRIGEDGRRTISADGIGQRKRQNKTAGRPGSKKIARRLSPEIPPLIQSRRRQP